MKIVAFLQLYNEFEKGNLIRCLENCKQWSDEIVIYDDCSDDGSNLIYKEYTDHVIYGKERKFTSELAHKKELLKLALSLNPDWIGWIDGDVVFDKECTEGKLRLHAEYGSLHNIDAWAFHNINMWRDPSWYRLDNQFNTLNHICFWRNNGKLHYVEEEGLHKHQFPRGLDKIEMSPNKILHYGFASYNNIINKYLTYKSYGQSGYTLDRLIDETSSFDLVKVPKEFFPIENIPTDYDVSRRPIPLTYNEVRNYESWEKYKNV